MLTVVAFMWHDVQGKCNRLYTYGPDQVRTLKRMLARHLSTPHELVCVTDKPAAVEGICRAVPLDMATFVPRTRYAKLMLFRRDIGDVIGKRILYLDMDCVIVDSLDPLVSRPEPLVLYRNPNAAKPRRSVFNSSIILMDAGVRPDIYERFDPATTPVEVKRHTTATDQAWMSLCVSERTPAWDQKDGIYSARRAKDPAGSVLAEWKLPSNARIVFFPGPRAPWMPEIREAYPWISQHVTA